MVVDLTYDSGVEDEEELVDLTSPVWVGDCKEGDTGEEEGDTGGEEVG